MSKVYLYNTEERAKQEFTADGTVGLYCCGPTVYNYAHIGNMRTYIFEDVLKRVLRTAGFPVKHVVNITDVGHLTSDGDTGDDKMEAGAAREGRSVWDIAAHYTDSFMQNVDDLNILHADVWPKATDHIDDMIDLVKRLEEKGYTYKTSDGIYFDTSKFPAYADFARLDPEQLQGGSRVEMGEKRNKTDFALWKFSPTDKQRAMEWDSPWGVGFPGWHIECSAMSLKYLPQPLDIHCGGIDHIQVHHTNEVAQVEAATGKPFCRNWIHGEFMVMDSGKMSKSKGNFITVDTLKEEGIDPLAYRLFCFSAHYRSPLTFSMEILRESAATLNRLWETVKERTAEGPVDDSERDKQMEGFYEAVRDDLNMPRALAWLWTTLRDKSLSPQLKYAAVKEADDVFALDLFRKANQGDVVIGATLFAPDCGLERPEMERIAALSAERSAARKEKDFERADAIRDELGAQGLILKDRPDGRVTCVRK
ncbi:MAG: cysteine--tRNA ligase [Fibrobacterota bacterium]